MRHLLCLALLLLPAAAAPDEKPAEDPRRLQPGHAPTPYTAEELRKACPEGRTDVIRMESKDAVTLITMTFLKCDEKGAEVERSSAKEDGTKLGSGKKTSTWKELQAHGSFPEEATKITEETIEVPAGKFECWLYTVNRGPTICRMYFAKKLPGPPVKMVMETEGKTDSTVTLVEHKEPAAKEKPAEGEKPAGG
ncbi:MAG: hypothetical protein ACHQ1G_05375 [Planctomycetota bacterium]